MFDTGWMDGWMGSSSSSIIIHNQSQTAIVCVVSPDQSVKLHLSNLPGEGGRGEALTASSTPPSAVHTLLERHTLLCSAFLKRKRGGLVYQTKLNRLMSERLKLHSLSSEQTKAETLPRPWSVILR